MQSSDLKYRLPATLPANEPAAAQELTLQERLAAINLSHAEINSCNLRDLQRQQRLLDAQRTELDTRFQALEHQSQEIARIKATAQESAEKSAAADQAMAEAERRLTVVAERERKLQQQLAANLEREIFPECLLTAPFHQWRSEVLSGGGSHPHAGLLRASLHLLTAAFQAADPEELCRALSYVGRYLYRVTAPNLIDEIARALNAAANNRYSLRVAHLGEPTEKSWMSFSGVASVNAIHGWAVLGPDRLKRYAAEVS
jgi:hypothetical protein